MTVSLYMRLDKFLAEKGYAGSRERAKALIEEGKVMVNGQVITAASFPMSDTFTLQMLGQDHPWVSRDGVKLDFALRSFRIPPGGRVALDIGAAIGGFTDVLLKRDAKHVYCVDTGIGQLHYQIAEDTRVTSWEQKDARDVTPDMFPEIYDLIVCDVSFISLIKALPAAMDIAPSRTDLIALIKPHFEVGPENVGPGGIVSDPELQKTACKNVESWLRDEMKWTIIGFIPCPIEDVEGNREFFVHAVKP